MQLNFTDVSYIHPDGEKLFEKINFSLSKKITALVGNNGSGKTTVFKMISDELSPSTGKIIKSGYFYNLPQNLDSFSKNTLEEILGVDKKLNALTKITEGVANETDYEIFDNDWELENRLENILKKINLSITDLKRKISTFSGGEISKIFFSSLLTRKPDLALLDEPTNNLDINSREFLYSFIKSYKGKIFVVSHDVELLKLADEIIELQNGKVKIYGGNYDFYFSEREREKNNLLHEYKKNISEKKSVEIENRKKLEVGNKSMAQGKKQAVKTRQLKAVANKRKQNAEQTMASKNKIGETKVAELNEKISSLETKLIKESPIKLDINPVTKTSTKLLIKTENFSPVYDKKLWEQGLDLEIFGNDRLLISGSNGCGKTSLIKTICGVHKSYSGKISVSTDKIALLNQNFLHLDGELNLYETVKKASKSRTEEHEIRIRLGRFLFYGDTVFKKVKYLSGGEKVRLSLLKMLVTGEPEILILDEPTNNLDLTGLEQLQVALNSYKGCLVIISHDKHFVSNLNLTGELLINSQEKHHFISG
ncbi:MAG: ABC-F family ATP-binding cassette domain-containing protein [Rhodothermaceae bacterium]